MIEYDQKNSLKGIDSKMQKNDQIEARMLKLQKIKEMGLNPFPYKYEKTHSSIELIENQDKLLKTKENIRFAGRIVRYNRKGKMCFLHLKDQCNRIQVMIAKKDDYDQNYELVKLLDIGDWIGVNGSMFRTKKGEYTIDATKVEILSKAIRPLPIPKQKKEEDGTIKIFDEFKDIETRYRQRYIDLTLNNHVQEVFEKRSKIVQSIREYLIENHFLEVETPVLQPIYGGANARPFKTFHNSAGLELYMRISNELYLKRCIVGGFERVFEFSKDFRNEGMDKTHNPEFTLLEFYQTYADYKDMMIHFENIYERACLAANGTTNIVYQGSTIDLKAPWPRITVKEAILKYAKIDIDNLTTDDIKEVLRSNSISLDGDFSKGRAIIALFEELCEEKIIQPTFIIDFPKESTPLCKRHREDNLLVEQFEPYINGWEVGNAYSELNDPILQRKALEEQVDRGRGGEEETHPLDENFLHAIECGMPPTGGVGISIDRMIMLLTNSPTIRDVILFPLMKP